MPKSVHGILLLDKPANTTSNAALQQVKRIYDAKKAGHTGSLDPLATGMLPICFGDATKFSQFLLDSDKTYYVTAKLGEQTSTGDREGEVIANMPIPDYINDAKIKQVLNQFLGESQQIPPMYSALKYNGKPLYALARKGVTIERQARTIHIHTLHLDHLDLSNNTFCFYVRCSKGTYIRTLVEDMAKTLGTCAHISALRRLAVSTYGDSALMYTLPALEKLASISQAHLLASLLPIETAVQAYPAVQLTTSASFYLRMGQAVRAPMTIKSSLVRLLSEDKKFLGVGEVLPDGRVKPHRLLSNDTISMTG